MTELKKAKEQSTRGTGGLTMANCTNCSEKCQQAEMAHQIALGRMYATKELVALIKKIENGELVEVVRCKDCVYWGQDACSSTGDDESFCTNPDGLDNFAHPDDFCSYGERKNEDAAD